LSFRDACCSKRECRNSGVLCHRCSQGGYNGSAPQIYSISCRFVLREAVSQTKNTVCAGLKSKYSVPPNILGWLRHCSLQISRLPRHVVLIQVSATFFSTKEPFRFIFQHIRSVASHKTLTPFHFSCDFIGA